MATASSAQREPSMEEILASIRRIIEDSDTGRQSDDASGITQDVEPVAKQAAADVDAFRAELRTEPVVARPEVTALDQPVVTPVEKAGAAVPKEEQRSHVTLAQVGAQLATEKAAPLISNGAPSLSQIVEETEHLRVDAIGATEPVLADEQPWGAVANSSAGIKADIAAPAFRAEPAKPATSSLAEIEPMEPVADQSSSRLAIVSEQTSRQVAAAFGELSEAFATRSKKTFDDKAEEMLKPMLQDWLDNNLPTLVERLVREEIERVARGA